MFEKDIISVDQFNKETLEKIYEISLHMEKRAKEEEGLDLLVNKVMAALFFEPSTRTRFSFESAMQKLGGKVVSTTDATFSSMTKGETLEDTIKTIERYADVIVIRHPEKGSAQIAADSAAIPIINAGDGPGEHPTQALLDFYTIKKEKGVVFGLKIAMVGDLKYGRTVHSLVKLLSNYDFLEFSFISPKELKMPKEYKELLDQKKIKFTETDNLEGELSHIDVLYMTRIQKERFEDEKEYERLRDSFILDKKLLEKAKDDMIIMHPLPRVHEISIDVDSDPRAKYFDQVENGLYVRMALLTLVLGIMDLKLKKPFRLPTTKKDKPQAIA